jgi:hypothetical protein
LTISSPFSEASDKVPLALCSLPYKSKSKKIILARSWWLMPVILHTQEPEIRRISVQSQPEQRVHETLSQNTYYKKRAGGGSRF